MKYWYAISTSFALTWKQILGITGYTTVLFNTLPIVVLAAWIAARSDDPVVLTYVVIGAFLVSVWHNGVFRMGFSLTEERFQGTLELNLVSRAPLVAIMLGKALALVALSCISGALAVLAIVAITRRPLEIAEPLALAPAMLFSLVALAAMSFLFAPLTLLVGGQAGFFNGIRPVGIVLSGFLYPVSELPSAVEAVARSLPTAWAMDAILHAIRGNASIQQYGLDWTATTLLSLAYLAVTFVLFKTVDRRIRRTAGLSAL